MGEGSSGRGKVEVKMNGWSWCTPEGERSEVRKAGGWSKYERLAECGREGCQYITKRPKVVGASDFSSLSPCEYSYPEGFAAVLCCQSSKQSIVRAFAQCLTLPNATRLVGGKGARGISL